MERTIKPHSAKALLAKSAVKVLDVRRKKDYDADSSILPNATWCDPETIVDWSRSLRKDQSVVIYCVRGGSVSNSVVDNLRGQGIDATLIEGGIEGWKAAGGGTATK